MPIVFFINFCFVASGFALPAKVLKPAEKLPEKLAGKLTPQAVVVIPPATNFIAPSENVFSVESNYNLWALVRLESQKRDIRYPFARRRGDFNGKNLRAMNAAGLDLSGFNFRNADLRGADLSECVLTGTDFSNADLSEAVLTSTQDRGALFDSATKLPFSREMALKRGWIELRP